MRPRAHYADKRGCPKCNKSVKQGFSINSEWAKKSKTLYVAIFKSHNEEFIKVGVTSEQTVRLRFQKGQVPKCYQVDLIIDEVLSFASKIEKAIETKFKSKKVTPLHNFRGYTECYDIDILDEIYDYIIKLVN